MGSPPFLYEPRRESMKDPPSVFNPKAITMASRQPPPPPKKKPDGPFVSFNQHPDSYLMMPYGNTDAKPMSPKIKTAVTVVRWVQFVLRFSTLVGAVGAMLCAIFIKGALDTEGYIMRIPVSERPHTRGGETGIDQHSPAWTLWSHSTPSIIFSEMQSRGHLQARPVTISSPW